MNISVETMKAIDSEQLIKLGYTIKNGTLSEASISDINGCAVVSATVLFNHGDERGYFGCLTMEESYAKAKEIWETKTENASTDNKEEN